VTQEALRRMLIPGCHTKTTQTGCHIKNCSKESCPTSASTALQHKIPGCLQQTGPGEETVAVAGTAALQGQQMPSSRSNRSARACRCLTAPCRPTTWKHGQLLLCGGRLHQTAGNAVMLTYAGLARTVEVCCVMHLCHDVKRYRVA
jgi:hypothetical protein